LTPPPRTKRELGADAVDPEGDVAAPPVADELDEAAWFADGTLVAPDDAVPLADGHGPDGPTTIDEPGGGRRGPSWAQVVVLALALAFLGGAVGYVIGKGRPPADDSVDVGFLQDMIDHHEQGVKIARITLAKDDVSPVVRTLAEEVLLLQQREIGLMDARLSTWGKIRGDLDRRAMTWMGMDTTVATMPGMQSDASIAALEAAHGADADRLYLDMMRDHHQGGVHMAQDARRHAGSRWVRDLATRIDRSQTSEIAEYTGIARQMGFE
jgi:uncharacterized protein (DUF305 family)